ncbi:MAG: hypothetical protein E3J70_09430 [Candidatus Heimdallarchaeota archaeon]|nr:MAG: hypothetical protein E3J70_09430 [Candidatus Heimdallarchaeota archaeon]
MQRRVFLIPFIVVILCSFTLNSKAEFNISVGDEFQYDVKTCNWSATIGPNSSSAQGFRIYNNHYNEGEDFTVKVIEKPDNNTAIVRFEKDGYISEHRRSAFGSWIYLLFMLQSPGFYVLPSTEWNETLLQQGPNIAFVVYPFFDSTESFWDQYEDQANSTYISSLMTATHRNYTDIQITYEEKKGNVFIERYMKYDYQSSYENTNFEVTSESNVLLSIELSTGVLQGLRILCHEVGDNNGTSFTLSSDFLVEIKDYNMPKFDLGDYAGLPGFTFYFVPLTLMLLVMTRFLIKKRRKKY